LAEIGKRLGRKHLAEVACVANPDNRLVASELERRWNDALQKVQQLEMRLEEVVRDRRVRGGRPEFS
jgi:hypothetical protein